MVKDVDLVIRARSEAERVLKGINDALGSLVSKQDAVTTSASKTDSVLERLKQEFIGLKKEADNLGGLSKISANLDKATQSVGRLTDAVQKQEAELKGLTDKSGALAQNEERLKIQADAAAASVQRQTASVAALKQEANVAAAEVRKLESALASVEKIKGKSATSTTGIGQDKIPRAGAGVKNETPGTNARESMRAILSGQLEQAKEQSLVSNARLQSESKNLTGLESVLKETTTQVAAAGREQRTLQGQVESATAAIEREAATLAKAKIALNEVEAAAQSAGKVLNITGNVDAARARVAASQAQTQARIDGLSAKRAAVEPSEDPTALNRQRLEAKRALSEAQAEVKRLADAMKSAETPTAEMGAALGRAQVAARNAKNEFQSLSEAAAKLKSSQSTFAEFSSKYPTSTRAYGASGSDRKPAAAAPAAPPPSSIKPMVDEARAAGPAFKEGEQGALSFRDALKGIYGDSRESLSLMQHIRGEVIALATAYVGVSAAIGGIKATVDAFKTLEAVQSRLGAVFGGDTQRVAAEVDFLKREAQRLGVAFSTLANEYGKVAIAGKQANFTSEETRKIFLSVAEAGRVNKLSQDQLSGVFLALTQMMSKGKVTSEELRRQLGDRLPGAFGLMAKALQMTEAELNKAMEAGEVLANSTTLLKFAGELDKQYGGQLPASLKTFTTELGRMQNNIEQAALTVGEGGLIAALFRLTKAFNDTMTSDAGQKFFLSLGASAAKIIDIFAALVPYSDQIAKGMMILVGIKLGLFFASAATAAYNYANRITFAAGASTQLTLANRVLGTSFMTLDLWLAKAQIGLLALGTEAGVTTAKATVLSGAIGLLRGGLGLLATAGRGILAVFGGLPGLIATGLTLAAGYWLTSVEKTTDELSTHKKLIDEVVSKYEEAKDKAGGWADKIKDASMSQLLVQLEKAKGSQKDLASGLSKMAGSTDTTLESQFNIGSSVPGMNAVKENADLFAKGQLSVTQFKKELDRLGEANPNIRENIIVPMIEMLQQGEKSDESVKKLEATIALIKGTATDAQKRLLGLAEAFRDNGARKGTEDLKAYAEALDELKSKIPELAAQMKRAKADAEAFDTAMKALAATGFDSEKGGGDPAKIKELTETYGKVLKANFDQETKDLIKQFGGEKVPLSLAQGLKGEEGYRSEAYKDQGGKPTIGFGATTKSDGSAVEMGDVITKSDAVKLFVENINKFAGMVDAAVGGAKLSENQRNALIKYVYNVGNTDGSDATRKIFQSIRAGKEDSEVAANIAAGVGTVKGVENPQLRARRKREAAEYMTPDDRAAGQDSGATGYDKANDKATKQLGFNDDIRKQTEAAAQNAANQKKINDAADTGTASAAKREVAIQTALLKAQNDAREKGVEISKEQLEEIRKTTTAEYDANHVNDGAKEAEEKVNQLYAARKTLIEDLKVANERGDAGGIATAEEGIRKMNEQIHEAIASAIKMWEAIGGTEADTAISKLRLMEASTKKNKTEITTAGQVNEKFASGLTNAFDQAAKGIGAAIAGTKSWKEAIGGLGIAFLNFAAEFIREIALMIIKALILKAIQTAIGMPGGGGGGTGGGMIADFANAAVASAHTGGVVGRTSVGSNSGRMVNPAWFANAPRYHSGGIAGLGPDEVATVLKRNEEVLTEDDPRHAFNGGKSGGSGGGGPQSIKSVILMDPNLVPEAMASGPGEKAVLQIIGKNKQSLRTLFNK